MGIKIGIGNIDIRNVRPFSWAAYWARQPEVLFFGLYSDISGGQMPNRVPGATDYLTVAGAVGSETYQCPNTALYIAADTDYIWFKTDTSQRTTTTAELVGYDLQRTPVKYDDATPYQIRWIMILNSTISAGNRNKLFQSFYLSVWWDNAFNDYGHIKGNRGAGQQLWTPETFWDTFTGADNTLLTAHTPDSANFAWLVSSGSYKITSNKAVPTETAAVLNIAYFDTNETDPDISITLTIPAANNYNSGLVVRFVSTAALYRILVYRTGGAAPLIYIMKNAVIVASTVIAHTAGDGILRCVITGDNFDVYWKGVKEIDTYVSDGSYNTSENHGLLAYIAAPNAVASVDNFSI